VAILSGLSGLGFVDENVTHFLVKSTGQNGSAPNHASSS